jgi:hypothetical protein
MRQGGGVEIGTGFCVGKSENQLELRKNMFCWNFRGILLIEFHVARRKIK